MSRIINELLQIRKEKSIAEAEIQLAIQRDMEKQKETRQERKKNRDSKNIIFTISVDSSV